MNIQSASSTVNFRVSAVRKWKDLAPKFCQALSFKREFEEVKLKFVQPHKAKSMNDLILLTDDGSYRKRYTNIDKPCDFVVVWHDGASKESGINLNLSDYTSAILQDDENLGRSVHMFDLCFRREFQKDPQLSISSSLSKTSGQKRNEEISFFSERKSGIFIGRVFNHQSLSVNKYIKSTGFDMVHRDAVKNYFDPLRHDHNWKKFGFKKFLERQREIFLAPYI